MRRNGAAVVNRLLTAAGIGSGKSYKRHRLSRRLPAPALQGNEEMRFILGFISMLVVGLVAAVGVSVGLTGSSSVMGEPGAGFRLDYPSLLLGLALGLIIATLSWVSWSELPRRFVSWVLFNERYMFRYAAAILCLAVLLFY
jgi:hypothetical protein